MNFFIGCLIIFLGSLQFKSKNLRTPLIPPFLIIILMGFNEVFADFGYDTLSLLIIGFFLVFLTILLYELIRGRSYFTLQGRLIFKNRPLHKAFKDYINTYLFTHGLTEKEICLHLGGLLSIKRKAVINLDMDEFDCGLEALLPNAHYFINKIIGLFGIFSGFLLFYYSLIQAGMI